jgi:hypothetical protein
MKRLLSALLSGFLLTALFPAVGALAQVPDTLTLPAGTYLQVRLLTTLSSKTTETGDPWTGRIVEPVFAKGQEVIPEGSMVDGHVTYVKEAGRIKSKGEMRLVAETITTPHDVKYQVVASLQDAQGAEDVKVTGQEGTVKGGGKSAKGQAKEAGIGAGAGAAVGAIAAGGSGALYGAGIGLAASLIHGLLKHGHNVILPQGTELTFTLGRDTTVKRVIPSSSGENPSTQ